MATPLVRVDPARFRIVAPATSLFLYWIVPRQEHGVEVHGYEEALEAVRTLAKQGKKVWIDPERVNFAFANVVGEDE